MDRLRLMSVFVAVAETQGFAAAARRLGMSPPAVTRAIAALEHRLRTRLLDRTTRYVRATEAGQRYLEDARRVIADADEADKAAAGINTEPHGQLAVTAPVLFGQMFVTPAIVEYLARYPGMQVHGVFLDRVVNLLEEGLDVGVRIGELPDSTLKAIRVGHVRRVVCASPAYLKAHGTPRTPRDLADHTVVLSSTVSPAAEWNFFAGGKPVAVKLTPRLTVTNNGPAIEAACLGFGVTRLLSYQVAPYVASGALKTILAAYEPPRLPIHVLYRPGRYAPAKVRTFVDFMVERLRSDKALASRATS